MGRKVSPVFEGCQTCTGIPQFEGFRFDILHIISRRIEIVSGRGTSNTRLSKYFLWLVVSVVEKDVGGQFGDITELSSRSGVR